MPTTCVVYGCNSRWQKRPDDEEQEVFFFPLPKDSDRRVQWVSAINRKNWTPKDHHRVCSRHFVKGRPSRNPRHPDFILSVNMGHGESSSYSSAERRLRRYERAMGRLDVTRSVEPPPADHRHYTNLEECPLNWKRHRTVLYEPSN